MNLFLDIALVGFSLSFSRYLYFLCSILALVPSASAAVSTGSNPVVIPSTSPTDVMYSNLYIHVPFFLVLLFLILYSCSAFTTVRIHIPLTCALLVTIPFLSIPFILNLDDFMTDFLLTFPTLALGFLLFTYYILAPLTYKTIDLFLRCFSSEAVDYEKYSENVWCYSFSDLSDFSEPSGFSGISGISADPAGLAKKMPQPNKCKVHGKIFIESDRRFLEKDDLCLFYPVDVRTKSGGSYQAFTMYKRVDRKIKPVSTTFSPDYEVKRKIPEDPLLTLSPLPTHPPEFQPTQRLTKERLKTLDLNPDGFLSAEEEKLFAHIMRENELALAFEDIERGTFKDSYFSPYKISTVPHTPWEHKNIPIPPGILSKVIEVLKLKMDAGVYEPCQSSYRSRWFCVMKKSGKLRIVHDLQPLNKVTVRDAGMLPILDDFVEGFAGRQCYTVFDLYWGFDARRMEPESRDMTAFMTPLGLLRITSMPTGFTNSPAEFQKCMVFILHEEIPHVANIFIDDLPIKGPASQYLDKDGKPETIPGNSQIRRFIWEHAQDVHRIMHKVKCAGGTFSGVKTQICRPEVLIVGQKCNPQGRVPDDKKASTIINWPALTTPQEVRRFLGLCGTVRIWILNYSAIIRPLTELYRKNILFDWDQRRQDAFAFIKKLVASAPALKPINYESICPVILSVDSSRDATGMILAQNDEQGKRRPARYGSIPMSERESRYSQPKLELFGLYRALRHWRLYIIGVRELQVEVDAQFIKGFLNNPDLQPDAAVNRWIQGILMFHFELIHVPAVRFQGPDALSRRGLGEGEYAEDDDDSWLDRIALLYGKPLKSKFVYGMSPDQISKFKREGYYHLPKVTFQQVDKSTKSTESPLGKSPYGDRLIAEHTIAPDHDSSPLGESPNGDNKIAEVAMPTDTIASGHAVILDPPKSTFRDSWKFSPYFQQTWMPYERREMYSPSQLPSCLLGRSEQEIQLTQIQQFLRTLEMPDLRTTQKQRRFIAKASEFYEREGRLWKRNRNGPPLVVILDPQARLSISTLR